MEVSRSTINNSNLRVATVALVLLATFITFSVYLAKFSSIEDSQQIIFPVLIVIFYFTLKKLKISISSLVFIFTFFVWIFLLFRVTLMVHFGYFEGRVIIGRLSGDEYGFEARELYKSLQKIALTYHLPGPALLPIASAYKNSTDSHPEAKNALFNLSTEGSPSIIIYGDTKDFVLQLPRMDFVDLKDCANLSLSLPSTICGTEQSLPDIKFLPFMDTKDQFLIIPTMPRQLKIPRKPKYAISHYIEWLAAYYSPLINDSAEVRRDVLFEASTVDGLPYGQIERTFTRILLSYEQIISPDYSSNYYEIENSKNRLDSLLRFVKDFNDPELYGLVLNLIAITDIFRADFMGENYNGAISLLKAIIDSESVSQQQKEIAGHNLGKILIMSPIEIDIK